MSATSGYTPMNRTIRKIDIGQVSLNLQDRLGLAKVKYQNGRLWCLESQHQTVQDAKYKFLGSNKPSDSSAEISYDCYETPFTSPSRNPTFSKELPRSARSKHAATFNSGMIQPMLSLGRKRVRSNSTVDRPSKTPRISWKSAHCLPESSPTFNRSLPLYYNHQSTLISEATTIPELPSPVLNSNSDEDNDPELPSHSLPNISSSMVSSSPPRTPPPKYARQLRNEKTLDNDDGADLLLHFHYSPSPARVGGKLQTRDFPPSTPPSQYAVLPSLTSTPGIGIFGNIGTPNQQFNFADFVNVTPSPAQRPWGGRTPGSLSKTPLAVKDARKRLNFDNIIPPNTESPKHSDKNSGLALQLGDELRH